MHYICCEKLWLGDWLTGEYRPIYSQHINFRGRGYSLKFHYPVCVDDVLQCVIVQSNNNKIIGFTHLHYSIDEARDAAIKLLILDHGKQREKT